MTRKFLLTGAAVLALSAGTAFVLVHPGQADRAFHQVVPDQAAAAVPGALASRGPGASSGARSG